MTNFEHYKQDILAVLHSKDNIAFVGGEVAHCEQVVDCKQCEFNHTSGGQDDRCRINSILWLYEEYQYRPQVSPSMMSFCMAAEVQGGYLAKDRNGDVWWTKDMPIKDEARGRWVTASPLGEESKIAFMAPHDCEFIKWADPLPWAVEDILKLEVEP